MYFIDTKKILKAALRVLEKLEEFRIRADYQMNKGSYYYASLQIAINENFGTSLSPQIYGKISRAISFKLHEFKKAKREREARERKYGISKRAEGVRPSVSKAKMDAIYSTALLEHSKIGYVGPIDRHIIKAIDIFVPDMPNTEMATLINNIKKAYDTDSLKKRFHSRRKRNVTRVVTSGPRPPKTEQLSLHFGK